MAEEEKSNVIPITKSKKYRDKVAISFPTTPPPGSEEEKEEAMLAAMVLGSRLMQSIESHGTRQIIVFQNGKNGWSYNYCNINSPGCVIEALAPLWHAARTALRVTDEY